MKYSQNEMVKTILTKESIINLYMNCLKPIVFKGISINPSIDCYIKETKQELKNLDFEEFKAEVFNDAIFERFSMVILYEKDNKIYSLCIVKEIFNYNKIMVSLSSHDKIWVNESLNLIRNFDYNNAINFFKINDNNRFHTLLPFRSNLDKKEEKLHWTRDQIIGVIAIMMTIITSILGWTIFRK